MRNLHRLSTALLLLGASGCFAPPRRLPDAEIVPCPVNERANTVLRNIIEECASSHGEWSHDMGPGCPRVWAESGRKSEESAAANASTST